MTFPSPSSQSFLEHCRNWVQGGPRQREFTDWMWWRLPESGDQQHNVGTALLGTPAPPKASHVIQPPTKAHVLAPQNTNNKAECEHGLCLHLKGTFLTFDRAKALCVESSWIWESTLLAHAGWPGPVGQLPGKHTECMDGKAVPPACVRLHQTITTSPKEDFVVLGALGVLNRPQQR